ncbi:hypothetical protein BD769DRAFT_1012026 [Suillus cothurnatus]|nr:hypothetical protein BD769DRAFT_1012026 [Suillus cothurnatus]
MQQRTLQIDSSTNSSMVVQVMEKSIQAKPTPLYDVATADGVYEYEDSPDETSQSTPLESQDTGESSRLNFRKNVDGFEQDLQLAMIPTKIANYVPQKLYQPRGKTEQEKYVHMADLSSPIMFYTEKPTELGIALEEILEKKSRPLRDGDDLVFEGSGRSISVRIEWPGYPSWNRQLATRDYRKTPGPITKAKLAKNLAICIRKFIEQMKTHRLEADSDPTWRISHIKFEDLVLDSLVHVSQGSWQPRLGLRRQMRGGSSRT